MEKVKNGNRYEEIYDNTIDLSDDMKNSKNIGKDYIKVNPRFDNKFDVSEEIMQYKNDV